MGLPRMAKRERKPRIKREAASARDYGAVATELDPRLVTIARAIGWLIAREQLNAPKATRDR